MPPPEIPAGLPQTNELAHDAFAQDEAVALDPSASDVRDDARLTIVIVDAGHSAALETPFLELGVPVTLIVDPQAPQANEIARLALQSGAQTYVQADAPLQRVTIDALHRAFPHAAGVAVRFDGDDGVSEQAAASLRRVNWGVFDEYGANALLERRFNAAGVRYAGRSITVDDHVQRTYVAFMLQQAVHLARGRTAIVMARPFPGTLQAFEDLLARAPRDGVRFFGL